MPFFRWSAVPAALLFCVGCGFRKPLFDMEALDRCQSLAVSDATVPGRQPDSTLPEKAVSRGLCFTEKGFHLRAKEIACDGGYELATLYNISQPGFLDKCYRADVDFYRDSAGYRIAPDPVVTLEPIPATGWVLGLVGFGGPVPGGPQSRSGLVNEDGDEASTGKIGFSLDVQYFPWDALGFEFQSGGLWGNATAPETKGMSFTRQWTSDLGIVLIPWQWESLRSRVQITTRTGALYTRMAIADEFKEFVEEAAPVEISDEAGAGWGWYLGGGLKTMARNGLVMEIGLDYSQEYPTWPDASEAFRGDQVLIRLGLGYAIPAP